MLMYKLMLSCVPIQLSMLRRFPCLCAVVEHVASLPEAQETLADLYS